MSNKFRVIRLRLKAYDYKLLDKAANDIASSARQSGAKIRGPFLFQQLKIVGLF